MQLQNKQFVVIFDCDGVMFDSRQANINYYNQILKKFGLPPMSEEKEEYVHMHTADESVQHILEGTSYFEKAQEFRKTLDYTSFIKDMIIEPGLKDLLRELKPKFGLAVATNRSDTMDQVLKTHGLEDIFDIVISSLDVNKPKPDPESLFKIFDFFQTTPSDSLYIGDSYIDYLTALAANVRFISYKNDDLKADYLASSMIELNDVIKEIIV